MHHRSPAAGYFQSQPVVYEYMRDTLIDFARNVIIPIPHRIGRTIRVELYFDAKWLMISEVRFESGEHSPCFVSLSLSLQCEPRSVIIYN